MFFLKKSISYKSYTNFTPQVSKNLLITNTNNKIFYVIVVCFFGIFAVKGITSMVRYKQESHVKRPQIFSCFLFCCFLGFLIIKPIAVYGMERQGERPSFFAPFWRRTASVQSSQLIQKRDPAVANFSRPPETQQKPGRAKKLVNQSKTRAVAIAKRVVTVTGRGAFWTLEHTLTPTARTFNKLVPKGLQMAEQKLITQKRSQPPRGLAQRKTELNGMGEKRIFPLIVKNPPLNYTPQQVETIIADQSEAGQIQYRRLYSKWFLQQSTTRQKWLGSSNAPERSFIQDCLDQPTINYKKYITGLKSLEPKIIDFYGQANTQGHHYHPLASYEENLTKSGDTSYTTAEYNSDRAGVVIVPNHLHDMCHHVRNAEVGEMCDFRAVKSLHAQTTHLNAYGHLLSPLQYAKLRLDLARGIPIPGQHGFFQAPTSGPCELSPQLVHNICKWNKQGVYEKSGAMECVYDLIKAGDLNPFSDYGMTKALKNIDLSAYDLDVFSRFEKRPLTQEFYQPSFVETCRKENIPSAVKQERTPILNRDAVFILGLTDGFTLSKTKGYGEVEKVQFSLYQLNPEAVDVYINQGETQFKRGIIEKKFEVVKTTQKNPELESLCKKAGTLAEKQLRTRGAVSWQQVEETILKGKPYSLSDLGVHISKTQLRNY